MTQGQGEEAASLDWQAQWIWPRGQAWAVNFHGLARREFALEGPAQGAALHISAYTDYTVWVNGVLVGRGPEPNDAWYQTYDSYEVGMHLRLGPNSIAVLAHNYALGTHWSHRGRGGLIAQLDVQTGDGIQTVATGADWKVRRAAAYAPNSPRQFWSADFLETFDFHRHDDGWLMPGFDDLGWETPDVLGPPPARPWARLLARDIPLLRTEWLPVSAAERGYFTPPPLHAVSFESLLPLGEAGLVYAEAALTAPADQPVTLHIECDDAFKLFLNGALVAEQGRSECFALTRLWRGKDEYDQVHDGMGDVGYFADVALRAGPNRLTAVVDQGPAGWGFLLALLDPLTRLPRAFPAAWALAGPFESTGMEDSLDDAAPQAPGEARFSYTPDQDGGVTDYATLMGYERRTAARPVPPASVMLRPGGFAILDLGRVTVGYPELRFTATEDAALDIGWSQTLAEDYRIGFSNGGRMKCVDRVFLRPGTQTWQPAQRRAFRFLHVSCRRGSAVTLDAGVHAVGYPVEEVGAFRCSDEHLNRIWEVSVYTTRLVMQQGWQDCLKREQGTLNTSSFNYGSRGAACAFGDTALARKNLRQAFRTQNETGWFDSHGISSPNSDEVTECLWLAVWLRDYHLYSGDTDFVSEVFDNLEDNLRFFAKGINRHGLIEGRNRPIAWQGQGIYLDDSLNSGPYTGLFGGELSGFNVLYFAALEAAADLAAALSLPERAGYYRRRAARVRRSLSERLWDDGRGLYRDWRDGDAQAETHHPIVQIAALHFGLGDGAQADSLLRYLADDLGLPDEDKPDYPLFTFGFYFYFLECLFRHGREQAAYDLLRNFYGRWLDLGATTFGEFFHMAAMRGRDRLTEEYEVHAYGTSALLHFYTNILGVLPLEPGFAKVRVAPRPGDLAWAEGTVATPHGLVRVSWRQELGVFTLDLTLPPACAYEVEWPAHPARRLTVNGQEQMT